MRKNRIHGIKPAKSIAIRWLGAYGISQDIESLVRFELQPARQVACEIMQINSKSGISHARVGLLVNKKKTSLVRAYAGDAYTKDVYGKLHSTRDSYYVTNWGEAGGLHRLSRRKYVTGRYIEGTIENPSYSAIIVKDNNDSTVKFATDLANATGLPIKTLLEAHIEEACC